LVSEWQHDRWSAMNAAANAIYLHVGLQRNADRQSAFEREAIEAATLTSS
jgi:hypothetical protein